MSQVSKNFAEAGKTAKRYISYHIICHIYFIFCILTYLSYHAHCFAYFISFLSYNLTYSCILPRQTYYLDTSYNLTYLFAYYMAYFFILEKLHILHVLHIFAKYAYFGFKIRKICKICVICKNDLMFLDHCTPPAHRHGHNRGPSAH